MPPRPRDTDGLAVTSRNRYLLAAERANAPMWAAELTELHKLIASSIVVFTTTIPFRAVTVWLNQLCLQIGVLIARTAMEHELDLKVLRGRIARDQKTEA